VTGTTAVVVRKGLPETRTHDVQIAIEVVGYEIDPNLLPGFSLQGPCLYITLIRRDKVRRRKRASDLVTDLQFPSIDAEEGEYRRSLRPYIGSR
jgi:hypothetical protein